MGERDIKQCTGDLEYVLLTSKLENYLSFSVGLFCYLGSFSDHLVKPSFSDPSKAVEEEKWEDNEICDKLDK